MYVIESVSFHSVSIKGHKPLFLCLSVIFQRVPQILPHLHSNCQTQMHFLNGHKAVGTIIHPTCPSTGGNVYVSLSPRVV